MLSNSKSWNLVWWKRKHFIMFSQFNWINCLIEIIQLSQFSCICMANKKITATVAPRGLSWTAPLIQLITGSVNIFHNKSMEIMKKIIEPQLIMLPSDSMYFKCETTNIKTNIDMTLVLWFIKAFRVCCHLLLILGNSKWQQEKKTVNYLMSICCDML